MTNQIDLGWCIDENCDVSPHVENCPECFGFGHRVPTGIIRASDAAEWGDEEYKACDVCGGSPKKEEREEKLKSRPLEAASTATGTGIDT